MSNVIEDNLTLRKELKEAFTEINRLDLLNIQKKQINYDLCDQIDKLNQRIRELESQNGREDKN